ncbi:MAG: hypothetical protein RLZZ548_730 [Bacteroidota bacterium]|jgi:hypothetical protein
MKVQSSLLRSLLITASLVFFSITATQTLSSCEKDTASLPPVPKDSADNVTAAQKAFDLLVLGKEFYMKRGIDSAGTDLTSQYADQIYILQKETYEKGPLTVTAGGVTYNGTWKANTDYSKLELTVAGRPDFAFYSIPWRVKNKTLTGLSMVPQDAANAGAKAMDLEKK